MSNLEKYRKVFEEVFCVDEAVLNEDFTFKGVDAWDSITHMTLITELEDTFDIMLETEDIIHYGSYLNGIEILKKYGVDFA
jgi:acyl carrier protein